MCSQSDDPSMHDNPAPAGLTDRAAADALLNWFDHTHGNDFGHDHHCPVPYAENPHTMKPDDRCTCGWSDVLRTQEART